MSEETNHSDGDKPAVPSNPLFGIESEKCRADKLAKNCNWLIGKIDQIHEAVCPDILGTWQQRASDCVTEAKKLRDQLVAAITALEKISAMHPGYGGAGDIARRALPNTRLEP